MEVGEVMKLPEAALLLGIGEAIKNSALYDRDPAFANAAESLFDQIEECVDGELPATQEGDDGSEADLADRLQILHDLAQTRESAFESEPHGYEELGGMLVGPVLDELTGQAQALMENLIAKGARAAADIVAQTLERLNDLRRDLADDLGRLVDDLNRAVRLRIRQIDEALDRIADRVDDIADDVLDDVRGILFTIPIIGGVAGIFDVEGTLVSPLLQSEHRLTVEGTGIGTPSEKVSCRGWLKLEVGAEPLVIEGASEDDTSRYFVIPAEVLEPHRRLDELASLRGEIRLVVTKKRRLWWDRKAELVLPIQLTLQPRVIGRVAFDVFQPKFRWLRDPSRAMMTSIHTHSGHPHGVHYDNRVDFTSSNPPTIPPRRGQLRIHDVRFDGCAGHPCDGWLIPLKRKSIVNGGARAFVIAENWSHSVRLTYTAMVERYDYEKTVKTTGEVVVRVDAQLEVRVPKQFVALRAEGTLLDGGSIRITVSNPTANGYPEPTTIGPITFADVVDEGDGARYVFDLNLDLLRRLS